jgi:hypothetical protein
MALVAMLLAVGWAGATTAAAQTQVDTDFSGGAPDANTEVVSPGDLALSPDFDIFEDFDGTLLPPGWEGPPWVPPGTGSATVAGGALTVDGARANPTGFYTAGRSLDFAATFTADPFQHVGFGQAFEDAPWAMFSTGGGALAVGLYARTFVPGGAPENTPITTVDPLVEHDYSIEWTATEVRFFIDGDLVATHTNAITAQMRPIASDFNVGGGSVDVAYVDLYSYPASGTFTSRVFDAGHSAATWQTLTAAMDTPAGTGVSFEARSGSTPAPDASWTGFQPVGPAGEIAGPAGRRYLQYRATLTTSDASVTPFLNSVSLSYAVPTTPTVTPSTPTTPTSPSTPSTPSSPSSPSSPTSPSAPPADDTVLELRPNSTAARVSRRGRFALRLSCPSSVIRCRIVINVRYRGRSVVHRHVGVFGGDTERVTLRLKRSAQRALEQNGRLGVMVVVTARDGAGNRARTRTRMTLRASE